MPRLSWLSRSTAGVSVLAVCSVLSGCNRPAAGARVDTQALVDAPVLRTYQVPAEYQDELRSTLQSVLGGGTPETNIGRVTSGPGGTLVVVAPARIQGGIEEILNADFDVPPSSDPIALNYWFLIGRPLEPSRTTQPYSVVGRTDLARLEPVLTQIAAAQGPSEFALLEQIRLTSSSQETASAGGNFARYLVQHATRRGEQVVADIEIALGTGNAFESRVTLDPGQFLVLGHTGYSGVYVFPDSGSRRNDPLTLYYVMAADLAP